MKKKEQEIQFEEQIINMPLEDVMHNSMMPYAQHVILERALPRVEDGLKPVQRRILYTLMELGLSPDKPHRKSARIVGDCLGKYHPHGDSSVYEAMVRMAQPFSMRGLLVDGHGNFGSMDGDGAAAMRYTEARMAPLALEMLKDIQKDTVDFTLNFDDTLKEPELLPARYPNLLVNGASGIAVGLATNIAPHNLRETIEATKLLIENEDAGLDEIMDKIKAPDFPTGGIIIDSPEIRQAYETGRGKITVRARVKIEDGKLGRKLLVIEELPYQVNKAQLLEKIHRLSEEKKAQMNEIYDVRDESDRTGMRAVVELKKDADPKLILGLLYKWSELQISFGFNMVAIANGKPRQLSLKEALLCYIEHQRQVLTRRLNYDLNQLSARAHILEGYMLAIDCLDETIQIIRSSKNPQEARERLMKRFSFSQIQAQAILDLRLQRLTGLELLALQREYAETIKEISRIKGILASRRKLDRLLSDELDEISEKYGDDRRSSIEKDDMDIERLAKESLAPVAEDTVVLLSGDDTIKRVSPSNLKRFDEENIKQSIEATTEDSLLFFTNLGNCFKLQVGQIEESFKAKDRGIGLPGLLYGLEESESLVRLIHIKKDDFERQLHFMFITSRGLIKMSQISEYAINRKNFQALKLADGDSLAEMLLSDSDEDVLLISRLGMMIRFPKNQVSEMGRLARGVCAMKLSKDDRVIFACKCREGDEIVLSSDRGYAKRLSLDLIERQNRAGKGIKSFSFNKNQSNGSLVAGVKKAKADDEVILEMKNGDRHSLKAGDILLQSPQDKGKMQVVCILDEYVTAVH